MKTLLGIALACIICYPQAQAHAAQNKLSPWHFVDDFSAGIPAWTSYPLAQDVGYDPSLYTAPGDGHRVLVRDMIADGQRHLRVGILKPLHFRITPATTIRLHYEIQMAGRPGPAELTVATKSGHKYSALLPAGNGAHTVELRGTSMGVPSQGADAAVVVIESDTEVPTLGSHNRLILKQFEIDAQGPAQVPVALPQLLHSAGMRVPVADVVVEASAPTLHVRAQSGFGKVQIALYDGHGKRAAAGILSGGEIGLGPNPAPGLWRAHLTSDAAESDFRFLVLGKVPPHPRLLLTPERLQQLRTGPHGEALRQLVHEKAVAAAAAITDNPKAGEDIALMSPVSPFPGLKDYFALLNKYSSAIALGALDYRLSGSRKSLSAAGHALLTISEWPTWTPPWFPAHGLPTYYEVGVFTQKCAFGYDLIADQLASSEKEQIANGFFKNSIQPTIQGYFLNDRMPTAASNHMANSVGGAIAATVALYGDVPDWNSRFGPALAELTVCYENLLRGLFPGDGSEAEPAGYQDFAMEGMSYAAAALDRIGIRPPETSRMIQSFWWPYYVQFKPGHLLDTGDFSGTLSSLYGFAWSTEHSESPTLRAFYDSAIGGSLKSVFASAHDGKLPNSLPGFLDLVCCTTPAKPAPPAPPSRIFPLRGSAALRSGWSKGSTVISIRVGPWFNHEHHDEGSFQVAAFGERLIGEAGYSDYYTDPRYVNYFTQVPGHNSIMLDDDPFSQNSYQGRYWPGFHHYPAFTRHVLGSGIDYLSADLTTAYDGVLKSFTRQYLFLKPDILILHDHLLASTPHRYSFLLHAPTGTNASVHQDTATVRSQHASVYILAGKASARWSIKNEPVPITAYRDFDRVPVDPRFGFALKTGKETGAEFTVGMQFLPSKSAPGTLRRVSTMNAEGFSTTGALVLFRTGAGNLAYHGHSTDGGLLASVGSAGREDWFAADSHFLRAHDHPVFTADEAVDAELEPGTKEETLQFFASRATTISIQPYRRAARTILLDGKRIPAPQNGSAIQIQLQQGEHSVRIEY